MIATVHDHDRKCMHNFPNLKQREGSGFLHLTNRENTIPEVVSSFGSHQTKVYGCYLFLHYALTPALALSSPVATVAVSSSSSG